KLAVRLALLPWDAEQEPILYEELLKARPQDFAAIRDALEPHTETLAPRLFDELGAGSHHRDRRFRAACALVKYAPEHPRWGACARIVVDGLIRDETQTPMSLIHWRAALEPVRSLL